MKKDIQLDGFQPIIIQNLDKDALQKRKAQIIFLRFKGMTYEAISKLYGISRQRVYQILKEANHE